MAITITSENYTPDETYFGIRHVAPQLQIIDGETVLTICNGAGTNRSSWGTPETTSTVVYEAEDLIAIHVGFHHKHRGSQFWRYYQSINGVWKKVDWVHLSDEDRQCILTAYKKKAPHWAKIPGKLRNEYKKPELPTSTTYKIVQVIDGRYYSVYKPDVEYVLNKRLAEKAVENHGGGYYSYPSLETLIKLFQDKTLFHSRYYKHEMELAIIECEISGTIITTYDNGKCSSTYLKPVREIKRFTYTPKEKKEAC
jgi:hypothetical protein